MTVGGGTPNGRPNGQGQPAGWQGLQSPYASQRGPAAGRLTRRPGFGRGALPSHTGPPTVSGRWSLVPPGDTDPTRRLHARALSLLDRYGIVIRGVVGSERLPGGFGAIYPVFRAMEETGQCRRGYFVEGLGAAQFALPGAVDRMRSMADSVLASAPGQEGNLAGGASRAEPPVVVLAAADPANAYGAALPWPPRPDETSGGHRPGRKAGALVILVAGQLVLYVERGGKTLLSWTAEPALLGPATTALAGAVRAGALGKLTVERADGGGVYDSPLAHALEQAGFRPTPRGLRLRGLTGAVGPAEFRLEDWPGRRVGQGGVAQCRMSRSQGCRSGTRYSASLPRGTRRSSLLHGGMAGASSWAGQTPGLIEAGYQVYLPERRGHAAHSRRARPDQLLGDGGRHHRLPGPGGPQCQPT